MVSKAGLRLQANTLCSGSGQLIPIAELTSQGINRYEVVEL